MADVERKTGTSDVTYDLISIIYHTLQGAETYEKYLRDAQKAGDDELAKFIRDVQEEDRRRAERAKSLLGKRFGQSR